MESRSDAAASVAPVPGSDATPRSALHHGIARTLGVEIIDGVLAPGASLTLETIQGRFGVSRTVAREVVRLLEGVGFVTSRRRVGITPLGREHWDFLHPTTIDWRLHSTERMDQLRSLSQLRHVIEPAAAAGCARLAPASVRQTLPPLAARMRTEGEAGRLTEFLALDVEFHSTILQASGNELFAAVAALVDTVLTGRTELGLMPSVPEPEALQGHEDVAAAIAAGDADAAFAAMTVITGEVRSVFDPE